MDTKKYIDISYQVKMFTDWHCGSGLAAGADVDALVVKDSDGIPYIPGKTIKGLLREAVDDIMDFTCESDDTRNLVKQTFGFFDGKAASGDKRADMIRGTAHFSNAQLCEAERDAITEKHLQVHLLRTVASTALDSNGLARKGSLRRMEVAVPCTLEGKITGVPEELVQLFKKAMGYVKRLGQNRNRGLGRCEFSIPEPSHKSDSKSSSNENQVPISGNEYPKTLKFRCTLETDVILNKKAATTGPNETLDFIPGSNFLGIAASKLYPRLDPEGSMLLFHSGKVRFGDAHPSKDGHRALKVPASMFYPKLKKPDDELYIHHLINLSQDKLSKMQLKQCREGFYDFVSATQSADKKTKAERIPTATNFTIKSAYDPTTRRSKDKQLFGYQSLEKGLTMYFSVEIDKDAADQIPDIEERITHALVGTKHIGRSRTAQYGLVKIEKADFREVESGTSNDNTVTVYADSRLIFLDTNGQPTFQPTAEQLGVTGTIDWEKSQIRTFRYAPWNFTRQCFDTDRCGIEKGSVFVVNTERASALKSKYVGSYLNEGFGKVIYNPEFLKADATGLSMCLLDSNPKAPDADKDGKKYLPDTLLLKYLADRQAGDIGIEEIYSLVNKWVKAHKALFATKEFASQWGTIRSLAQTARNMADLKKKLFEDKKGNEKEAPGYLLHGVAKDKWEGLRLKSFKEFVESISKRSDLSEDIKKKAVVNLASEMAKKCK